MNFKGFLVLCLAFATTLTGIIITLSGLSPVITPILTIIWLIATLPSWAIFACHILRLPFAHTFTGTKITILNLGIFSPKPFTTLRTIYNLTSPSKISKTAFVTASDFSGPCEHILSVGLCVKFLTANWASQRFSLFRSILTVAGTVTEPKVSLVVVYAAWFALNVFFAIRTLNSHHFHKVIIAQNGYFVELIACENPNK